MEKRYNDEQMFKLITTAYDLAKTMEIDDVIERKRDFNQLTRDQKRTFDVRLRSLVKFNDFLDIVKNTKIKRSDELKYPSLEEILKDE